MGATASEVFRAMDQELKFPERAANNAQDETLVVDIVEEWITGHYIILREPA